MASLYNVSAWFVPSETINLWLFVYYIHQCLQFLLVILAYWLTCRFAFWVGLPRLEGTLLVSGLFLFNYPLFRTLQLNQVNLYVLNALLVALLWLRRFPFWSGAAIAIGSLIKVYPVVLGIPLLGMKRWRAILGALIAALLLILLQTGFGSDLSLWRQFIRFYLSFPVERESSLWFRNSSLLSFVRNLVHLSGLPEVAITPLFVLVAFVALVWIIVRFVQREKIFRGRMPGDVSEHYRYFGHLIDFSVLTLLVAPSAWDHHFVLSIPLALWAIALRGREQPIWVGIGIVSIFVMPAYNIFPFSYLRLFGVLLLLWLTPPKIRFAPIEVARAWRAGRGAAAGRRPS